MPDARLLPLATAAFAVALVPSATAAPLELGPGAQTRVRLDRDTARHLDRAGISLRPIAGARGRTVLLLPSTGGEVETTTAQGVVRHRGGVRLRRGRRSISLTAPVVRFRATSTLEVSTRGRRVALGYVVSREGEVLVRGADIAVAETFVTLTPGGASLLNRALGTRAFRRGLRIGAITVRARPAERAQLLGGTTDLALDPAVVRALNAAGVQHGPVPPAQQQPDGTFALPIGRNSIVATGLQTGTVHHGGGLKFQRGPTALSITDPMLRFDAFPTANLRVDYARERVPLADLDLTGVRPAVQQGSFVASGIGLRLTAAGVQRFNETFGTALQRGQLLGTVTVRGRT